MSGWRVHCAPTTRGPVVRVAVGGRRTEARAWLARAEWMTEEMSE